MKLDLKKNLLKNIELYCNLKLLKKKSNKFTLLKKSLIASSIILIFFPHLQTVYRRINFGSKVKTEIIANNIAIPVNTPK